MNKPLLIWGAGGHAKVVLDVSQSSASFQSVVFLDDDPAKAGSSFCNRPILGGAEQLHRLFGHAFIAAVGDNHARAYCFRRAIELGLSPTALVHSRAIVAPTARIGAGTVIMPGAIVNADAVIGENCIINSAVVIEHDCKIGAHAHLSPRVVLGGGAIIGALAHVGIGAVVLPGATVGEEAVVGAGAVVLKDAPARCTVVGVPARALSYAPHQ